MFTMVQAVPAQNSSNSPGVFVGEVASLAPGSLDPASNFVPQGEGFLQLMYEGLYQYTNNSVTQVLPSLAVSYSESTNGSIYTFKLRSSVTFSLQSGETTGQPFNAYVMQYSLDRAIIMDGGPSFILDEWIKGGSSVSLSTNFNKAQAITFLNLQSIQALDANTLQIALAKPYGGFIQALLNPVAFAVSPKAIIDNGAYSANSMVSLASFFPNLSNSTILSDLGLPNTYNIDNSGVVPKSSYPWLSAHSAGTGPYTLTSFKSGSTISFTKNYNWWNNKNFQQNSVDSISITQVSTDATRVSDLQQGTVDTADIPISLLSKFDVSANHLTSNYTGINTYVYNTLSNEAIGMNMNATLAQGQVVESSSSTYMKSNTSPLLKYGWKLNGKPQYASPNNPFSALLFREAFAYAFPYDSYIQQAYNGFAIRMQGVIPKGMLGYDNNLIANENIPTNNSATATKLFQEVGWTGTVVITYPTSNNQQYIAANLLKNSIYGLNVGITVQMNGVTWNTYLTDIFTDNTALLQVGWNPDYAGAYDFASSYYLPNATASYAMAINYNNSYVNNLMSQAVASTSPTARSSFYNQMEVNATGDFPYIYLDQSQNVLLAQNRIQDINNLQANSLNPIMYTLEYQFLGKQITITSSNTTATTTNTNSTNTLPISTQKTATPGFEAISIISIVVFAIIIDIKKKKLN